MDTRRTQPSTEAVTGGAPTAHRGPGPEAYQAFRILHLGFVVAPILAGLDKFVGVLAEWEAYLWPGITDLLGIAPGAFMAVVGVVEIAAGVLVALKPRIGGWVVAGWLAGIILNLVLLGAFLDVALRDLGLLLGAVALARLAAYHGE